jgi:hypothetical protein
MLLGARQRPRLKYVKVLEQSSEVVLLKGPVLLGIQRRPHWEQLRVDTYQRVEATSGVESPSDRIVQRLPPSIRVDQYDANRHRPIIAHVVNRAYRALAGTGAGRLRRQIRRPDTRGTVVYVGPTVSGMLGQAYRS